MLQTRRKLLKIHASKIGSKADHRTALVLYTYEEERAR